MACIRVHVPESAQNVGQPFMLAFVAYTWASLGVRRI